MGNSSAKMSLGFSSISAFLSDAAKLLLLTLFVFAPSAYAQNSYGVSVISSGNNNNGGNGTDGEPAADGGSGGNSTAGNNCLAWGIEANFVEA